MRRAVLAHQSRPVEAKHDRQLLQRRVVDDVVHRPLHERRIDVAERDFTPRRQSGGESDGMSFGDPHVVSPFGHPLH